MIDDCPSRARLWSEAAAPEAAGSTSHVVSIQENTTDFAPLVACKWEGLETFHRSGTLQSLPVPSNPDRSSDLLSSPITCVDLDPLGQNDSNENFLKVNPDQGFELQVSALLKETKPSGWEKTSTIRSTSCQSECHGPEGNAGSLPLSPADNVSPNIWETISFPTAGDTLIDGLRIGGIFRREPSWLENEAVWREKRHRDW